MVYLKGLKETIEKIKGKSAFDSVLASKKKWCFYCSDGATITGILSQNDKYDLIVKNDGGQETEVRKLMVEFLFPLAIKGRIEPLLELDEAVKNMNIEPTEDRGERHHIKNRTLYPLVVDHEVITVTFISGKRIKGQLTAFTPYEILLTLEGKLPVVVLRHAVHHAFSAAGLNLLKEVQQKEKAWRKSRLWIEQPYPHTPPNAGTKKKKRVPKPAQQEAIVTKKDGE